MRTKPLTVLGAAWLHAMSLQAPFAHFHPQDLGQHHSSGFAHMHLGSQHGSHQRAAWQDHDDDETSISQEWVPAGAARFQMVYAEVAVASALNPGVASVGVASEFTVRSHDPPNHWLLPARAPPL